MRKLTLSMALLIIGVGSAFGIIEGGGTFPNAWLYDGLITYDPMGLPPTPKSLHVNAGIGYLTAGEVYDHDGKAWDLDGSWTLIGVPIDIGYAFTDRIMVDVTLQFLSSKVSDDDPEFGEDYSAAGLSDVWVKGRYVAPVGNDVNLGGRLGVKVPVGKVDYDDDKPELGDGQMDIDVAAVASRCPENAGFAFNGQVGFRYRMTESATLTFEEGGELIPFEVKYTPGLLVYTHLEPGYSMGQEKFQVYMPIGYMMTTGTKVEAEGEKTDVEDSETNGFYVGLAPKYGIDAKNTVGLKFLYPIKGTGGGEEAGPLLLKSMSFGLTYEGYIPL